MSADGDKRKHLVEKFDVGADPTSFLMAQDGKILDRSDGYQGAKRMVTILRKAGKG